MNNNAFRFMEGGGELGRLIREFDWSSTSIGAPGTWPQSLRTTLSIVLSSRFPMFLWWGPDMIQFYNDAYRPSLGISGKHPAVGMKGEDSWQEIWPVIKPLIDRVWAGESNWSEDQLIPIYRNGKLDDVYWTFSYSPVKDEDGNVGGILVICHETTNKVKTNLDRETAEKRFRSIVRQAPVGITILMGPDFVVESANDNYLMLIGKTEQQFIGRSLFETLPEVRSFVEPLLNDVIQNGNSRYGYEFEVMLHRYGKEELAYFNFVYQPLKNKDGVTDGVIVVATEVTEQVKAKKSLEESERQFRKLMTNSPIAMCIIRGPDLTIEIANNTLLKNIWNRELHEVQGRKIMDVFPELADQHFPKLIRQVMETGVTYKESEAPAYVNNKDVLRLFYLDFEYAPLLEPDGSISGLIVTVNDVTERVNARMLTEEAEKRYRQLIESVPVAIFTTNAEGYIDLYNKAAISLWGRQPVIGEERWHGAHQIYQTDGTPIPHEEGPMAKALQENRAFVMEMLVERTDGSQRHVITYPDPIHDLSGNITGAMNVLIDITELKDAEKALRASEEELEKRVHERTADLKNANFSLQRSNTELEQFAYIASHDLQEPLRKIRTFTEMLEGSLENMAPQSRNYLSKIAASATRMRKLIQDVLHYSRLLQPSLAFEPVDLNQVLRQVITDFELLIQEKQADVILDELPVIAANPLQMNQLFTNLISNSLKFCTDKKPVITLKSVVMTDEETAQVEGLKTQLPYFKLVYADNGIGFDQQYADQIFMIFQRLHSRHEFPGTGIGLALCKKIALNHQGHISATSKHGEGATFTIMLPGRQHN